MAGRTNAAGLVMLGENSKPPVYIITSRLHRGLNAQNWLKDSSVTLA